MTGTFYESLCTDFRLWYVGGVNLKKGRTIVIAIDFGSSMDRNKSAIEAVVDRILLLTGTHYKVCYLLIMQKRCSDNSYSFLYMEL